MEGLNKLLELVKFGKDITLSKHIHFFNEHSKNSFEEFLISARINVFIRLALLDRFDEDYYVGYLRTMKVCKYPEMDKKIVELGPSIIAKKIDAKHIFETLLSGLGVSQIIAQNWFTEQLLGKDGELKVPEDYSIDVEHPVFISREIIMTEYSAHVKAEQYKPAKEKVDYFLKLMKQFYDTHKNASSISHELYVGWLLKWFPGQVHVRSIENK